MRHLPVFVPCLPLLLALAACHLVGASVGVGSTSGMAMRFSSYNDFLYTGPDRAYADNKRGLEKFLAGDYAGARADFEATLAAYPANPDAVYYLGLTRIQQGEREAGFALLRSYNDRNNFRITEEVRWWAAYCAKKPELAPDKIREVMNRVRAEAFQQQIEEDWEDHHLWVR